MRHLEVTADEANAHVVSMFTLPLLVLLVGVGSVDTPSEGERSILPVGARVFGCIIYQHAASAFIPDSPRRSSLHFCSAPASHRFRLCSCRIIIRHYPPPPPPNVLYGVIHGASVLFNVFDVTMSANQWFT